MLKLTNLLSLIAFIVTAAATTGTASATVVIRSDSKTGWVEASIQNEDAIFKNSFENFVCQETDDLEPCSHAIYGGTSLLEKCEDFNETYLKIKEFNAPNFELVEKHIVEYACTGYDLDQKITVDQSCVIVDGQPARKIVSHIYSYCH